MKTDLANVWAAADRTGFIRTLAWGDEVIVLDTTATSVKVEVVEHVPQLDGSVVPLKRNGFIVPTKSSGLAPLAVVGPARNNKVLRVNFIDVQQGDAAVVETPDGKVVLIDGGEQQLFARYLAGRFRDTTPASPKTIDCVIVSHGDADHFAGLPQILESETNATLHKRLFIRPLRVFHNGIVKRPSRKDGRTVADQDLLGPTVTSGRDRFITDLVDDIVAVPDDQMNEPFREWKQALQTWNSRHPIEQRRLQAGSNDAFSWFNTGGLRMEVLGPLTHDVNGAPALRFLGKPVGGVGGGHDVVDPARPAFTGLSASHTINGQSVIVRLSYGSFSFLFAGDLNDEASRVFVDRHARGDIDLSADVLKVPHHGSADFSRPFLAAVAPLISVVSSGDESIAKEYIHPRATLMGALARYSKSSAPLVFVTELVAFFQKEGYAVLRSSASGRRGEFFGFSRAAWGSVKTRTDGTRLVVFTDSANAQLKEAYAFVPDTEGVPQPSAVVRV